MSEDDKEQKSEKDLDTIALALFNWVSKEDEGIVKEWLKIKYREIMNKIVERIIFY